MPLAVPEAAFYSALRGALDRGDGHCRGQLFDHGAILRIRQDARHVWSPALHLHVEEGGGGGPILHGRFTPSSPVWTAFVAIYIALLVLALSAVSYGGAQVLVEEEPWAFWGLPLSVALAAFTYGAAFIGQGLGAEDMHHLRSFVEGVLAAEEGAGSDGRGPAAVAE